MATIVNNPGTAAESSSNSMVWVIGIALMALLLFTLLFYGGRNWAGSLGGVGTNPNSSSPQGGTEIHNNAPGVEVPKDINVDVNTNPAGQ